MRTNKEKLQRIIDANVAIVTTRRKTDAPTLSDRQESSRIVVSAIEKYERLFGGKAAPAAPSSAPRIPAETAMHAKLSDLKVIG